MICTSMLHMLGRYISLRSIFHLPPSFSHSLRSFAHLPLGINPKGANGGCGGKAAKLPAPPTATQR